ncbi:DKNYY domain-containing protein [Dyadobacter psychrophilus]|uniref:DKNYY family protein n=1 Tax=Dyadobacter psychrophilus TaxID=651661 RepID=A0A1T5EL85_9BACT|nr:DKNYY domain-containing protein [Dyadobacter psychrophilus]SKB84724.1 DKNYY family protein [Dyadobacter psychrophilus]
MAFKGQLQHIALLMGLLGFFSNLLSCSDQKSGFKPGLLTARGYYVKNGKAYWYGGFSNASLYELTSANADKFVVFDKRFPGYESASEYAGDDKVVYYEGWLIKRADSQTFQILEGSLSKDAKHVFSKWSILSDDAQHFTKVEGGLYKDRKHVYRGGYIVSDDPDNLKFIGEFGYIKYFSDSKGIIANDIRIDSVDVNSFKPLQHGYAVDKSQAFILQDARLERIKNVDTRSFDVLTRYYTRDKSSVFWRGEKLTDANPGTFKIISEEHHCSCDDKRVYHQHKIIPNADPARFPVGKKYKYCNDSEIVFE